MMVLACLIVGAVSAVIKTLDIHSWMSLWSDVQAFSACIGVAATTAAAYLMRSEHPPETTTTIDEAGNVEMTTTGGKQPTAGA